MNDRGGRTTGKVYKQRLAIKKLWELESDRSGIAVIAQLNIVSERTLVLQIST
jgi:hypothetical protein